MINFLFRAILLIAFLCFCSLAWTQNLMPTDKLALLKGVVTNFKGRPLSKEVIMFVNDRTKAIVKVNSDPAGKFAVLIPVSATMTAEEK